MENPKDETALARYGCDYDQLSAWGKRVVDRAYDPAPTYSATLDRAETETRQVTAKLQERNAFLEQENEDLWEQLNETRAELEELRSKFNPPLS